MMAISRFSLLPMLLVLPSSAAMTVTASFEGGDVGRVEYLAPTHLRCAVKGQSDQNGRNRQASWYYFRIDGAPKAEIRVDLTDLVGEYNFRPGSHPVSRNTRPVYSYDNRNWTAFRDEQVSWDEKEMRFTLRFTPARRRVWIAHTPPYGQRELNGLLKLKHPHLARGVAGRTVHGREIPLLTITDPTIPDAGKKSVWLMARQHGWEAGTSWVADGAVRFLLSDGAKEIRRSTVFQIIPLFDMDGASEGFVRFNANGYDNNRNWDTAEPGPMPEISSVREKMRGARIDLFLAMHNTESVDYVEGPAGAVGEDLVKRLRESTSFYDPKSPRDGMKGPIDKGRYTVNQWLYKECGVQAFLMELMVDRHPGLGHPRTARDFAKFGAGLAKSLAGAAQQ